ncbi:MAG: hypothetical protein ABWZ82_05355 [Candidatus Limnocylindrales bacterium]
MRLPRPLLIAVVVIIVLGVASCGVSIVSLDDDPGDPRSGLTEFLDGLMPGTPPVELDTTTAPCLVGEELRIDTGATCQVTILPTGDLRRELVLRVTAGRVRFDVDQVVGGRSIDSGPEVVPTSDGQREVSVVVQREDSAGLALACLLPVDCVLAVNPD